MNVLLDTCVILDVLQDRKPFSEAGKQIFLLVANNRFEGHIAAKALTDIYYIVHRSTHNDSETRRIMISLSELFDIIDTLGTDCLNALLSPSSDYEDAVMIETAIRSGMDYIVTRNISDYSHSPISVLTPDEFLLMFEEKMAGL